MPRFSCAPGGGGSFYPGSGTTISTFDASGLRLPRTPRITASGALAYQQGVFVRNLTNKAYIVNALTSSAGFGVGYTPPREIGLSLHHSF